jgi:hypothetical protein
LGRPQSGPFSFVPWRRRGILRNSAKCWCRKQDSNL